MHELTERARYGPSASQDPSSPEAPVAPRRSSTPSVNRSSTVPSNPAAAYSGWAMRADQAALLQRRVGGEIPGADEGEDAYVILVEATDGRGRSGGGWSLIPTSSAPVDQIHLRGRRLVEMLGDKTGRATVSIADFRGLDVDGEPPAKRGRCPCGSGARAKHCHHDLGGAIYATAETFISQKEWARRDRESTLFAAEEAAPVPSGATRIAGGLHTLSMLPLGRAIRDVTAPGAAVVEADDLLAGIRAEVIDAIPMLGSVVVVAGHTPRAEFETRAD